LAPRLASLHREHANNGLGFLMVGRGDADENRRKAEQYGIEFPVVMQEKWKLSKEYGIFSTPVAFLIGEDGVIQKNVAVGVDAITTLAQDALTNRKD
jgi:peroxiredoxin